MGSSAHWYLVMLLSLCCMLLSFSNVAVHGSSPPTALFVFGDSLSDIGNNNYNPTFANCDFHPYGIDLPTGNPTGPTGRCSNGKNVVDFVDYTLFLSADKLGVPSPKSYMSLNRTTEHGKYREGVNFASASAGILKTTHKGLCIPLDTQIDYYSSVVGDLEETMGVVWTKWFISNSVVHIDIGSNDVLVYNGTDISNYRIYDLGARKFAFMALQPIGCFPASRAKNKIPGDCDRRENQLSVRYNEEAALLLRKMQSKHANMRYSYFHTYKVFSQYINDPQKICWVCGVLIEVGVF
ncbi:putative GDSL lipase/esterase, SGNH hydrolase superfamily [Dioscorea sansibarensis]